MSSKLDYVRRLYDRLKLQVWHIRAFNFFTQSRLLEQLSYFATTLGLIGILVTLLWNKQSDQLIAANFWAENKKGYNEVKTSLDKAKRNAFSIKIQKKNCKTSGGLSCIAGLANENYKGESTIYLDDGSYWEAIKGYWNHVVLEYSTTQIVGIGSTKMLWDNFYEYVVFNALNRTSYSRVLCHEINGSSTMSGIRHKFKASLRDLFSNKDVVQRLQQIWNQYNENNNYSIDQYEIKSIDCLKPDRDTNLTLFKKNRGFSKFEHRIQFEFDLTKEILKHSRSKNPPLYNVFWADIDRKIKFPFGASPDYHSVIDAELINDSSFKLVLEGHNGKEIYPDVDQNQSLWPEDFVLHICNPKDTPDKKCMRINLSKAIVANPRNSVSEDFEPFTNTQPGYHCDFYPNVKLKKKGKGMSSKLDSITMCTTQ